MAALAVNIHGVAVGWSVDVDGKRCAVIYDANGLVIDLNSLLVADDTW